MNFSLLFFLGLLNDTSAAIFSDQPCPNRPTMKNIDVKRLGGIWYIYRAAPNYHQLTLECSHNILVPIGSNMMEVNSCENFQGLSKCMRGIATLEDPKTAKFNFTESQKSKLKKLLRNC